MDRQLQIQRVAERILALAKDSLLVHLRFLDLALPALSLEARGDTGAHLFDGERLFYAPVLLIRQYQEEAAMGARLLLHSLLHCIFSHSFGTGKLNRPLWDLATDIATERVILSLRLPFLALPTDKLLQSRLDILEKQAGALTAERIYRHFQAEEPSEQAGREWRRLSKRDEHIYWDRQVEFTAQKEQWRRLSERVKTALSGFGSDQEGGEALEENLREALKERYNYRDFLRRFAVFGEAIGISDEEFDYVYYTYGLFVYGNMPLVEPLEHREERRVKDFVIALDTSASCRGALVRAFLRKTFGILRERESFFTKVNLHILQCDSQVRQDILITGAEDMERFLGQGKLTGFGATDFRPAFDHVERLRKEGAFADLKGMIYFTDGYGVYPERMPDYDVAFVFLRDDDNAPKPPPWAIRIVWEEDAEQV